MRRCSLSVDKMKLGKWADFFNRIVFRVSEGILEVLGLVVCHRSLRLLYLHFVLVFSEWHKSIFMLMEWIGFKMLRLKILLPVSFLKKNNSEIHWI